MVQRPKYTIIKALKVAKVSAEGGQLLRRPNFWDFLGVLLGFGDFFKVLNLILDRSHSDRNDYWLQKPRQIPELGTRLAIFCGHVGNFESFDHSLFWSVDHRETQALSSKP